MNVCFPGSCVRLFNIIVRWDNIDFVYFLFSIRFALVCSFLSLFIFDFLLMYLFFIHLHFFFFFQIHFINSQFPHQIQMQCSISVHFLSNVDLSFWTLARIIIFYLTQCLCNISSSFSFPSLFRFVYILICWNKGRKRNIQLYYSLVDAECLIDLECFCMCYVWHV